MQRHLLKSGTALWRKTKGRSKVVAVTGVTHGVGVTHTSIMIANYLRRQRLKVAVVELSGHRHFERIEKAYEGSGFDPITTDFFKIKQVIYYKNTQKQALIQLYKENYDVMILDIGQEMDVYSEDIQMADLSVVIAHTVDWKREEIKSFMIRWKQLLGVRTRWLFPYASHGDVKEFMHQHQQKGGILGMLHDPFVKDKTIDEEIRQLFDL